MDLENGGQNVTFFPIKNKEQNRQFESLNLHICKSVISLPQDGYGYFIVSVKFDTERK